jgi:hypothetical protein
MQEKLLKLFETYYKMSSSELDDAIITVAKPALQVEEHSLIGMYLSSNGHVDAVQWCMAVLFARGELPTSVAGVRLRVLYHVGDLCVDNAFLTRTYLSEEECGKFLTRKNEKVRDMLECFGNPI